MWSYDLDAERGADLTAVNSFESVIERVATGMQVRCRHIQSCDDMAGFRRVVYCISVPFSTFDAFFNAEHGYRGAYYRSAYEGLAANDRLISAIAPELISWAQLNGCVELDFDHESLSTPSAKAWLAEAGLRFCAKCEGEWTHPQDSRREIINGRWENAEDIRGRKAPLQSKIRIFGAFLSDRLGEFVAERKRHRARQLHEVGWS